MQNILEALDKQLKDLNDAVFVKDVQIEQLQRKVAATEEELAAAVKEIERLERVIRERKEEK